MLNPCNDHSPKCCCLRVAAAVAALAPSSIRHLHYYDEMQISLKDTSAGPLQSGCLLVLLPYFNMCAICPSLVSLSMQAHVCACLSVCVCARVNVCVPVCYSYANYISCVWATACRYMCTCAPLCVRVRVCVSVCVLILHADTHLVQNIIQFFWKSQQQTTTTTTGQRAHKCFLSLSRSLSLLFFSLSWPVYRCIPSRFHTVAECIFVSRYDIFVAGVRVCLASDLHL